MTPEEFLEAVKATGVMLHDDAKERWQYAQLSKNPSLDSYLYVEWRSGGVGGGSCWDEGDHDPHYAIDTDPEPDFEDYDKVVLGLCENISYSHHKALTQSVFERDGWSNYEYYGNYTNYSFKKVVLRKLYDKLKELGVL